MNNLLEPNILVYLMLITMEMEVDVPTVMLSNQDILSVQLTNAINLLVTIIIIFLLYLWVKSSPVQKEDLVMSTLKVKIPNSKVLLKPLKILKDSALSLIYALITVVKKDIVYPDNATVFLDILERIVVL